MTAPVRPYRPDNPFAQSGAGSRTYRPDNPFANPPQEPEPAAPEPTSRPSWLGTQARATVAGVGGAGLRTLGRVARALDTVTPERLRSNMGPRFEGMAEGLRERLTPEDPARAREFGSGALGAELASELVKYGATGVGAARMVPEAARRLASALAPMGLGAVEDVGSRPEESVPTLLAMGADLAGADRTASYLRGQAESPVGRMTVGALLGLVPEAVVQAPGALRNAARNRRAIGAVAGADYVPERGPEPQKLLPAGQYEMPPVREPVTDPARLLPAEARSVPRPSVQYDGPAGPAIPTLSPEGRLARELEAISATPDDVARYQRARDGQPVPSPSGRTARRPGGVADLESTRIEREAVEALDRPDPFEMPMEALQARVPRTVPRNLSKMDDETLRATYALRQRRLNEAAERSAEVDQLEALMEAGGDNPIGYEGARRLFGTAEDARRWANLDEETVVALSERGLTPKDVRDAFRAREDAGRQSAVVDRLAKELERRGLSLRDEVDTSFDFGHNLRNRPGFADVTPRRVAVDDARLAELQGEYDAAVASRDKLKAQRIINEATGYKRKDWSIRDEGLALHRPASPDYGAPAYDLTEMYPDDVYGMMGRQYYGTGNDRVDNAAYSVVQSLKGRPNAPVTIYRAVDASVPDAKIRPGDWVTTVRSYAKEHGESTLRGQYKIVQKKVYARDIYTSGDSWAEWGYHPQEPMPDAIRFRGPKDSRTPLSLSDRFGKTTDPNRPGAINPETLSTLGGAVVGGAVGGAVDPEADRGVLLGATAGALGGRRAGRFAAQSRPAKTSTPALDAVRQTINAGDRDTPNAPAWLTPAERAYTELVSETFPLVKATRLADGAEGGRRMQGAIAQAQGAGQAAFLYARESLGPVWKEVTDAGLADDVRAFAKARRDLDIRSRGGASKSGVDEATLRQAVADGNANPVVKRAADRLTEVHRELLRMRHEAGLLDDAAYQAIVDSEDFYTPFVREFVEEAATKGRGSAGRKWQVSSSGVAKMDRTAEAIAQTADPFEVAVAAITRTHRDIGRQRVQNVLTELADAGQLPFVRRVTGEPPKHGRTYSQLVGGEKVTYEVTDPDLYDAIVAQDRRAEGMVLDVMRAMKQIKQQGITLLPDFAVANVVRDTPQFAVQRADVGRAAREVAAGAGAGGALGAATDEEDRMRGFLRGLGFGAGVGALARPATQILGAMRSIVKDDAVYRDFLKQGGSTEGFNVRTPKDAREALRRLQGSGVSLDDVVSPKRWVDALRFIGSVGEQAPRLAKYTEARGAGIPAPQAAFQAQDVSLRFSNVGKGTKTLASVTEFWNAKVQGWDKLGRLLRNPKTYPMAAALLTGPSLALWSVNKDNPEYWERPSWERNLFWLVPKDGGGFWRVPKPFELGYLFASLPERMLDYAAQSGKVESAAPKMAEPEQALRKSALDMATQTTEGTVPIPTALSLPLQLGVNQDFFRRRPIVRNERLPAEQQVDDRTSAIARQAGRVGLSPQQVDFALRDVAGTAGRQALGVTDAIARRLGLDAPDAVTVDRNLVVPQRFQTKEYQVTETESLARDRVDRAERVYEGLRNVQRSGTPAEVSAYRRENADALRERVALGAVRKQLDDIAGERRKVLQNPRLSEDRKAERLKQLRSRALVVARRALAFERRRD